MPKYKLTYFDGRGRAEVSRMLFAQAGQEYEDERIQEDSWGAMKPKTPFGQLPLLEVDGLVLCQSHAIARYLAKSFGLAGKTELDQAKADMIVDTLEDMIKPLLRIHQEQDKGRKGELQQKSSEDVQTCLQGFEKLLTGDFFLGDEITWADFTLVEYIMWPPNVGVAVNLDKHPKIKALIKRVETSPKIAEWIKKRPKSDW